MVPARVPMLLDGPVEQVACPFDLLADLGQVKEAKWGAVLFDQIFKRNAMKSKVSVNQIKSFLREIIGLINEIEISILHDWFCKEKRGVDIISEVINRILSDDTKM